MHKVDEHVLNPMSSAVDVSVVKAATLAISGETTLANGLSEKPSDAPDLGTYVGARADGTKVCYESG